ncbi:MAG: hypothetical protein AAF551_15340 [Bacteroidota bacterium]
MIGPIVFCIISVAIVAAVFLAWFFYQKARDRERMYLLEKGEKLEEIFLIQKRNKFKFIFPWLKLGVVSSGMSLSFLIIAFLIKYLENGLELFKGFLITFIIGSCLGVSFIINHFLGKNRQNEQR